MATANKVEKTKVDSARTTPASPEWWAQVPDVSDPEPTLASITFNSGKEARRFGTVLQRVVDAEVSDILARAALLHKGDVLAISKVLRALLSRVVRPWK